MTGKAHCGRPSKKPKPYGCHRQFQPQIRPSIRLKSRNDRPVTHAAEDLDRNVSGQPGSRLLGLCDADLHQPASGRAERSLRRQSRCDGRRHPREFSRRGIPRRWLSLLEVLRQTSGRAACQASVGPFHFRWSQPSYRNRSVVCIGISARDEKMNDKNQENEATKGPMILTAPTSITVPGFGFLVALDPDWCFTSQEGSASGQWNTYSSALCNRACAMSREMLDR